MCNLTPLKAFSHPSLKMWSKNKHSGGLWPVLGNTVEYIGIGNDFLNRTPKAQHVREKMNKTASN
jgi:hypothetical protein